MINSKETKYDMEFLTDQGKEIRLQAYGNVITSVIPESGELVFISSLSAFIRGSISIDTVRELGLDIVSGQSNSFSINPNKVTVFKLAQRQQAIQSSEIMHVEGNNEYKSYSHPTFELSISTLNHSLWGHDPNFITADTLYAHRPPKVAYETPEGEKGILSTEGNVHYAFHYTEEHIKNRTVVTNGVLYLMSDQPIVKKVNQLETEIPAGTFIRIPLAQRQPGQSKLSIPGEDGYMMHQDLQLSKIGLPFDPRTFHQFNVEQRDRQMRTSPIASGNSKSETHQMRTPPTPTGMIKKIKNMAYRFRKDSWTFGKGRDRS